MNPFSITVDYIEGPVDGTIRVEAKPNIILYQIPHSSAQNLTDNDELKKAGIYLLLNRDKRTLYIGQANLRTNGDGILKRVLEAHSDPEIDSWQVAFVLTSSTPLFLRATELNYLEKFFYDEAVNCGRYNVLNRIPPHSAEISPSTKMILDSYTELAFFLLWHQLRCKAFVVSRRLSPSNSRIISRRPKQAQVGKQNCQKL